ncbi:MAG: enoyl-CoA hydratase/isomerase family protein [Xanthomonadales bacterium]|nr:enoyl-CoA hydratase/isomerase family protein [Gammaproteobacteria bacterium]NNK50686.1 enoyl-CoA hydratase/isomerase family protein [Xanthomonadales bacterium]
MKFETIKYETEGPLAWITLNRPEKLNAISKRMVSELKLAADKAQCDDAIRIILLTGEGRAFSAGFDLDYDPDSNIKDELYADFDLIMRFWDSPKPTIAAVHTYCLGGALELAIACDITLAASDCRFGEPEVKFGSGIVAMLLPYVIGPKRAKEMLLTGNDRITSEQAEKWGLVNRVVKPERLIDEARSVALEIARNDQHAVRITKQALNNTYEIGRMRDALKHALELDVAIESTETDESRKFNEILRQEGTKAAIDWRDRQMGLTGKVKRHDTG